MTLAFKHIFVHEEGGFDFTSYFEYLDRIKNTLPSPMAEFATDVKRYDLKTPTSMHDAWLTEMHLSKEYYNSDGYGAPGFPNAIVQSTVELEFLLTSHHKQRLNRLNLAYSGVEDIIHINAPQQYKAIAVDLLAHEFDVLDNGMYSHLMMFSRDVWIQLVFKSFSFKDIIKI